MQNISDEFIVISKSGMNDHELLTGRPYGGTAIFLRKTLNCTITNCEMDCGRLCATMVDFKKFTVLFSCFYMPCDSGSNCDSYNHIRSGEGALKAPPPLRFFALTHLILELHYCVLGTFPKK